MSSKNYLVLLLLSFLVSLSISLYFVESQVEKSISSMVEGHTLSSAELTTSKIEQFFSTRVQVAKDLASQPLLISSVMGATNTLAKLNDFMDDLSILGEKEPVALYDILGETVYDSNDSKVISSKASWFRDIIDSKAENAIFLVNKGQASKFAIALPLKYNNLVEGVIVVVFSDRLENFLNPLTSQSDYHAVSIRGPYLEHNTISSSDEFESIKTLPILGTGLIIDYLVDQASIREERLAILFTIVLSIIIGLLISFSLLALLGRKLILNPYRRLEGLQYSTQQALRDLENLKYAVDQHSIVAITDIRGTILFANEKFSEISGYKNEELVGQNHRLLNSGYHNKAFFTQMFKTISQGQVWSADICNRNKQGKLYWVDTTIVPLRDADGKVDRYIAIRSDITDLKQAEEEIAAKSLRMQLATNASGIGIWEWDLVTNELVWDDWMYSLYGVSPSTFSGAYEAWENQIHPDDLDTSRRQLQDAIDGKSVFEPEFRVVHPNGDVKTIKAKAQVFRDASSRPVKMIGVNYDITDKINALQMAKEARDKAQQAAQAKSEFLANMSHEIRTPMNGVIGMLELLKHTDMDKEQAHKLKVATSSAQSLLTLINDILDLSKIEAGKLELEAIAFDLRQLLSDSVEAIAHLIEDSQSVQLLVDVADINTDRVIGDPGRLRQIVTNLLSNAIKFTSQGSIILTAKLHDKVEEKLRLTCSVRDTGIGIPKEKADTLFDQFTQVDASTTRKYGGTGLGLSIVKHLCVMMGGEIHVESEDGNGSCFTFNVELGATDNHEKTVYPATLKEMKVLVLDANPLSRSILQKQFEVWGINVDLMSSTEEASPLLETKSESANAFPYDVILIDADMPDLTVSHICTQLSGKTNAAEIRLLVLGSPGKSDRLSTEQGAVSLKHIAKPLIPSLIMDALIESDHNKHDLPQRTMPTGTAGKQDGVGRKIFKDPVKILLVEDNKINQMVAQSLLSAYGLEVDIAENGREAIEVLAGSLHDTPYALALMDCHMPEMDGYEATESIRQGACGEAYSKLPIIAMTANAMQGDREKCLQAGMDDYVTKPINETLLQNALIKWISPAPAGTGTANVTTEHAPQVWNQQRLMTHIANDKQRLHTILKSYISASGGQKNHLLSCIDEGDFEKIARVTDSIASNIERLGGESLGHALNQIKQAAKAHSSADITASLEALWATYDTFTSALESYLDQAEETN